MTPTRDPQRGHARRVIGSVAAVGAAAALSVAGAPIGAAAPHAHHPGQLRTASGPEASATAQVAAGVIDVAAKAPEASPRRTTFLVSPSRAGHLPDTALYAYQQAASVMASVKPGCHLHWSVLAAIGGLESDHGQSAGATLGIGGTSSPAIRGRALDGSHHSERIPDTDHGELDQDTTWDRGMGPMQLLPSAWRYIAIDGDQDGVRSPDDLNDAALAAGVYLCAGNDDVSGPKGMTRSLHRYNRSRGFTSSARALARAYRLAVPDAWSSYLGTHAWVEAPATPSTATAIATDHPALASHPHTSPASSGPTKPRASTGTKPSPTPSPEPSSTPSPTPEPSSEPSPTATPSSDPPVVSLRTLTGTLLHCGTDAFCVDDQQLVLSGLDAPGVHDYDQDGEIGTRREELDGLTGTTVVVEIDQGSAPTVLSVNGLAWE